MSVGAGSASILTLLVLSLLVNASSATSAELVSDAGDETETTVPSYGAPPFLSPDYHAPDEAESTQSALHFLRWTMAPVLATDEASILLPPQQRRMASVAASAPSTVMMFPEVKVSAAQMLFLERYRTALNIGNQDACPEFLELSTHPDFSLHELAKIRYWLLCPTLVKADDVLPESSFSFFEDLRSEAEMVVSERAERWDPYLRILGSKIRNMKILRERTKALEMGLQVAELKGQADHAKTFRAELERLAPRFLKNPKPEDFLAVGQDWITVREFDRGRSYLLKASKQKKMSYSQRRRALQMVRNSFKTQQNKKTHLVEAEKYFRWLAAQKDWAPALEAGMYWVRALWTEGQKSRALAEMVKLERDYSKRTRIFEIEFIRGRMAEEDAEYVQALIHYDKALSLGGKGSGLEIKIEASRGWALRQLGKDLDAAAQFEAIANYAPDQSDQLRARFWQAKSFFRAGLREKAKVLFRQVAYDDPVGYYGLIAFRELGAPIPPLSQSREESLAGWGAPLNQLTSAPITAVDKTTAEAAVPVTEAAPSAALASTAGTLANAISAGTLGVSARAPDASSGGANGATSMPSTQLMAAVNVPTAKPAVVPRALNPVEKTWIQELQFVGEKQILQAYLDGLAADPTWNWTSVDGLSLLKAYAHSGLYLPLFATIGKIEKAEREQLLLLHPELLFPRDFEEMISAAAEIEGIPKELIFSIIRQESAFNPNARSWADAMGLMQILPMQAKNVAGILKLDFQTHDDLFLPDLNIPIGAHMLRQGLDKYKRNFILAIASYNANDKAIRGWLKTRFRDDPVEFIEEIAYDETRGYVKLVLRNYIFYKRLQNPEMALAFPPECLPDLQNFKDSGSKEVVSR